MPRYYESEALIEFVKQNTPHMNGETTMKCVEFAIKNAPTADVAEVVRCKDCKFWTPMDNGISWHHQGRTDGQCEKLWQLHCAERHLTKQDHFCSYGERKE